MANSATAACSQYLDVMLWMFIGFLFALQRYEKVVEMPRERIKRCCA